MAAIRKRKREIQNENADLSGNLSVIDIKKHGKRRKFIEELALSSGTREPFRDVKQLKKHADVTEKHPHTPTGFLAKTMSAMFRRTPSAKTPESALSRGGPGRSSLKLLQRDTARTPGLRSSMPAFRRDVTTRESAPSAGSRASFKLSRLSFGRTPVLRGDRQKPTAHARGMSSVSAGSLGTGTCDVSRPTMLLRSMSRSPGERPQPAGRRSDWRRRSAMSNSSSSSIGSVASSKSDRSKNSMTSLTSGVSSMSSRSSQSSLGEGASPPPFSRRPSLRLPSPGLSIKGITLTPESQQRSQRVRPEQDVKSRSSSSLKSGQLEAPPGDGGRVLKTASRRVSLGLGIGGTLRSSMKSKILETMRKNAMRGKQDYSLPAPIKGEFQYLQFISAQQAKEAGEQPTSRDQWLQTKIDHEIRMRDGTAKLLAAAKHPGQMLEAARGLLTSNSRMLAYMSELQRRKTEALSNSRLEEGSQVPCKARLCVSDIRIPLMWRDTDHFKNKGDYRRYAVFCLLRRGTEVYDTSLARDVDRTITDISFDDVIVFNDVPSDFSLELEVYCHRLGDDLSIANTPKKIRKKISELGSSVGRSVGRRLSGVTKDEPDIMANMLIGPKFERIAQCTMRLSDTASDIRTYDLTTEYPTGLQQENSGSELPMFGNFCCRLAAQPQCLVEDTVQGHVMVQSCRWDTAQRFYCTLRNLRLSCWDREEDAHTTTPVMAVPVTKATQVSEQSGGDESRGLNVVITCSVDRRRMDFTLHCASRPEFRKWWEGLQQHMLDQVMWQHACEEVMEIRAATAAQTQTYPACSERPTSLYDDMPCREEGDGAEESPMARVLSRLQVEEAEVPPVVKETGLTFSASAVTTDV